MADNENPWKTLGTHEKYDNPWFRVTEHEVINISGNPGIYGKISFKNIACGIIPLDEQDNTWIVGQYRYTLDEYSWEIPMGGVPVGADLLDGARRELKEETGLIAKDWEQILKVHISNSVTDEVGFVYVAKNLAQDEPEFGETEKLAIRRLPFAEALGMAMNGGITDALSVAGILKLAAMKTP